MGEHTQQREQRLAEVVSRVAGELLAGGALSAQSLSRMLELHDRFARFVQVGFDVQVLDEITSEIAGQFVGAPSSGGRAPSLATQHLRRSAVRLFFRIARALGIAANDPTLDLRLAPRSLSSARPLADEEVALCRTAALHSLTGTRLSAAWALAEATARTSELAHLRVSDLDLQCAGVWIHGSPRAEPRWGRLSRWGCVQLERRLRDLGPTADAPSLLIYAGDGSAESRQASSCQAISETLRRAGLDAETDVRPVSVAAWAGVGVLRETGRIEAAARALGCRSLDTAARIIGLDWRGTEEGE